MRESFETEICVHCGEEVDAEDPRNCWLPGSSATVFCFECARRLGGVYDKDVERWVVSPKHFTTKLPEDDR